VIPIVSLGYAAKERYHGQANVEPLQVRLLSRRKEICPLSSLRRITVSVTLIMLIRMDEADSGLEAGPKIPQLSDLLNLETPIRSQKRFSLGKNLVKGTTCVMGVGCCKKRMPGCND